MQPSQYDAITACMKEAGIMENLNMQIYGDYA